MQSYVVGDYRVFRSRLGWHVVWRTVTPETISHLGHVCPPFATKSEALRYARSLPNRGHKSAADRRAASDDDA